MRASFAPAGVALSRWSSSLVLQRLTHQGLLRGLLRWPYLPKCRSGLQMTHTGLVRQWPTDSESCELCADAALAASIMPAETFLSSFVADLARCMVLHVTYTEQAMHVHLLNGPSMHEESTCILSGTFARQIDGFNHLQPSLQIAG